MSTPGLNARKRAAKMSREAMYEVIRSPVITEIGSKGRVGRAEAGSELGAVPGLGEAFGPNSDQRRDLVVERFSYALAVRR